ncbi:MAG: hypothetical protein WBQ23_05715 [Bacteroidota bacterium]
MENIKRCGMILLLNLLLGSAASYGQGVEGTSSVQYHCPVYFTANTGQWDKSIRYGILGDRSSAWFMRDGITLVRPSVGLKIEMENPSRKEDGLLKEAVQLSFVNPSPSMRIRAVDTAVAVSHFYLGTDSSSWHPFVSNHRRILYENVWDGIDIEYREGRDGSLCQTIRIAPGSDPAQIRFQTSGPHQEEIASVIGDAIGKDADIGLSFAKRNSSTELHVQALQQGSGFRYKDTLNLTSEFNTGFQYATSAEGIVVSPDGEVTIEGTIDRNVLPVRNAIQGQLLGGWDNYILRFDTTGQDILFCTYLGGAGVDASSKNHTMSQNKRALQVSDQGNIIGCFNATIGAPIGATAYKNIPALTETGPHVRTCYVFNLNPDGSLHGATYLGGPGIFDAGDLYVGGDGIYILGFNYIDSLTDISRDAPLPSKPCARCWSIVLAKLNLSCSELNYMTYVLTDDAPPDWFPEYASETWGQFTVNGSGEAIVAMGLSVGRYLAGQLSKSKPGILVVKYSSSGEQVLFSRIFDKEIPGRYFPLAFGVQSIFTTESGEIDLFGICRMQRDEPLPPRWTRQTVVDEPANPDLSQGTIWAAKLSTNGELIAGTILGDLAGNAATWYNAPVVPDLTCGGYMMFIWSGTKGQIFTPMDPVDASRDQGMDRYLVSIDQDLRIRYATPWNSAYFINGTTYGAVQTKMYLTDRHGFAYQYAHTNDPYSARQYYRSWRLPKEADPCWPKECGYIETYLSRFRFYTPCWQVGCLISTIDSLRLERRRGYTVPNDFIVNYSVTNFSPAKSARIVHVQIELPAGFALVSGTYQQAMSPNELASGLTATCSWKVRVSDPALVTDTALIRCRVFYIDPESGQTYPMGEELCEKDVFVSVFDAEEPALVCTVDGPEEVYWVGNGYSVSPTGNTGPIPYTMTITNLDKNTVVIDRFRFRVSPKCRIFGDSIRPGLSLAPGTSQQISINVYVNGLRYDRMVRLQSEALDVYGVTISTCEAETRVPGIIAIPCMVSGPDKVSWNTASGSADPALLSYTLQLDNQLDTVRTDVRAWLDISRAPHLGLSLGDSLSRALFSIPSRSQMTLTWRLELLNPPAIPTFDTLAFVYECDGLLQSCIQIVEIQVIDEKISCSLTLPSILTSAEVESRTEIDLDYTLSNVGTVPVDVDRLELAITPATAGLNALDPITLTGTQLAAGGALPWSVRLRAAILRDARNANCTVTAYGKNPSGGDTVLSVCNASIAIEEVDGLRCAITATDSVRFERDSLRYNPDPLPVQLDLRNILDTDETVIEAEIDLANAPRFVLAAGENAIKTLARIDSHATAAISWLLTPKPGPTDETQDIRIRYRSTEQGVWKECNASIIIEAWPNITEVLCATGGHDSLHADAKYEDIIPKPFEISYTATNSGTVTLTNCTAAIILPAGFALAGSDSIQSFGTLASGESAKRWWTLTPSDQLSAFGPYQFNWQWKSDEQGTVTGCAHTVQLVPDASGGIVFTPLHLYFEAEMGGTLPAAQNIQLWTGGGLSMPWTAQSDIWYLDLDPVTGDHTATIAVRPNTSMLNKGMHASAIELAGSAQNLPKQIEVQYLITSLTSTGSTPAPSKLSLGPVYPHPIPLQGEARIIITSPAGRSGAVHVTLHDLLGRERALLLDGVITDSEVLILRPAALGLEPGSYLLRLLSPGGMQSRMVTVVR